jgi:DNA-binding Lrp family transcriptional regulator
LDDLDLRILGELLEDSRISLRKLADKLDVAVGTVQARIKRMEKEGIIRKYTVILDHEKLGFELTTVTEVIVSKGKLIDTEKEIAKIGHVMAVYDVTGETDIIVVAKFRNREELSRFTKKLLSLPFVERTNTHVVLTTIKEDFRMPSYIE